MKIHRFVPITTLLLALGCSGAEDASLDPGKPQVSKKAVTPLQDGIKARPQTAPFVYQAQGRRDPFRSYLLDAVARRKSERASRHVEETETLELSQYHLSGILTGTSQPKAMVEDPTGRGHVVRIGSRLGRAGGRVSRIDSTGLVVTEESLDPTGHRQDVPIAIKLPVQENDESNAGSGASP